MRIERSHLSGVLEDAAARLEAAGFHGVQCREEVIQFPGGAPIVQKSCAAPGHEESIGAELVMMYSDAQLRDMVKNQLSYVAGAPSYFADPTSGAAPGVSVISPAVGPSYSPSVPSVQPTQGQIQTVAPAPPAASGPGQAQAQQTGAKQTPQAESSFEIPEWAEKEIAGFPTWAWALGALGIIFLMGKK